MACSHDSLQNAGGIVAVPVLEAENDKVSCQLRRVTTGERAASGVGRSGLPERKSLRWNATGKKFSYRWIELFLSSL